MTPAALSLARRVRELLSEPGRWTQGWYARDSWGFRCPSHSSTATCWCIRGAITRNAPGPELAKYQLLQALDGITGDVEKWNDLRTTTHADVLALLDRVIADGER